MTTTTGSSAATAPLMLMSAPRHATSSIVKISNRARLVPAFAIRSWPAHAVTPVASSPSLTTNSDAMKMTAELPRPASASFRLRMPVA